jgi:hypothetical protein
MKEIKLSDGRIVKMRKPKVKDSRAVSDRKDEADKEIALFANLTGLSEEEIGELYLTDYALLQEAYVDLAIGK